MDFCFQIFQPERTREGTHEIRLAKMLNQMNKYVETYIPFSLPLCMFENLHNGN